MIFYRLLMPVFFLILSLNSYYSVADFKYKEDLEFKSIGGDKTVADMEFKKISGNKRLVSVGQYYLSLSSPFLLKAKKVCERGGATSGISVYKTDSECLSIEHSCGSQGCSYVFEHNRDESCFTCN